MRYVIFLLAVIILAGCGNYYGRSYGSYDPQSSVSADPGVQIAKAKADELQKMRTQWQTEANEIIADSNELYNVRIPAFCATLDDAQLEAFGKIYVAVMQENLNPVQWESMVRQTHHFFTDEQVAFVGKIVDDIVDISDRKSRCIEQYAACEAKRKELQQYCESALQSLQAESEAGRQQAATAAPGAANGFNQGLMNAYQMDYMLKQQQPSQIYYYGPGRVTPDGFGGYRVRQPNSYNESQITPDGFGGYYIK